MCGGPAVVLVAIPGPRSQRILEILTATCIFFCLDWSIGQYVRELTASGFTLRYERDNYNRTRDFCLISYKDYVRVGTLAGTTMTPLAEDKEQ